MAAPLRLPSADYLRSVFAYDEDSGDLRWKQRDDKGPQWNGHFSGKVAGNKCPTSGYVRVRLDGKMYVAQRLVFKWVTGADPLKFIDHRDGDRTNNRWRNLREASMAENNRNVPAKRKGKKGAFFHKPSGKWLSMIGKDKRYTYLGCFGSETAAHAAYCNAAQAQHGVFANFGTRK